MGNAIPRTNIFPGDTNVQYVLSSTDGPSAYFSFAFYRNSMESKPAFIVTIGAEGNTLIKAYRMDETTGSLVDSVNIANYSIPSSNVQYGFDICGENLVISDMSEIIGSYNNVDLQFMTQYQGGGSSGTVVMAAAPTHSNMQPCTASGSISSFTTTSSLPPKGFPWWGVLLIVLAVLLVLALVVWMVYALVLSSKEKRAQRSVT